MSGFDDEPVFEKLYSLTETEKDRLDELSKKGWPTGQLSVAERMELEYLKFRMEK